MIPRKVMGATVGLGLGLSLGLSAAAALAAGEPVIMVSTLPTVT